MGRIFNDQGIVNQTYQQPVNQANLSVPKNSQTSSSWFTPQDLPIILQTLKGLIPGMGAAEETLKTPFPKTYGEQVKKTAQIGTGEFKRLGKGIPEFLASSVTRPLLTLSELLGGPSKVGPFTSGQEEYRQVREAGGGKALAFAMPILSELLAVGGLKGIKSSGIKGKLAMEKRLPTEQLKEIIPEKNQSAVVPKVETPDFGTPETPMAQFETTKGLGSLIKRAYKFGDLSDVVEQYGSGGKRTTDMVLRYEALKGKYAAGPAKVWSEITKGLKEPEKVLLRDIAEGRVVAPNEVLQQKALQTKELLDWLHSESQRKGLEIPYLENYFPRRLSQAGKDYFGTPSNYYEVLEKMAEAKQAGITDVAMIFNRYIKPLGIGKQKFMEYTRQLTPEKLEAIFGTAELPKEFRANPDFEMYNYINALSSRWAATEEWGKDWSKINSAIEEAGFAEPIGRQYAEELRNRAYGYTLSDSQLKAFGNKLAKGISMTLLGPQVGYTQNITQFLNAIPAFGVRSTLKALVEAPTAKGKTIVQGIGKTEMPVTDFPSWAIKNISGFRTEKIGISRTALAAADFIERNFKELKKNPDNVFAQEALNKLHIHWQPYLQAESLPPTELAIGTAIGVRKTMFLPYMTSAPKNLGIENVFRRFSYQQGKLIVEALTGKDTPMIKKFGRMGVFLIASAIAGEIPADISYALRRKKREGGLIKRGAENLSYAGGFGLPLDLLRSLTTYGGLASFGAGVPWSYAGSQAFKGYQALTAKKPETRARNAGQFLLNMPFIPAGSTLGRLLFPAGSTTPSRTRERGRETRQTR